MTASFTMNYNYVVDDEHSNNNNNNNNNANTLFRTSTHHHDHAAASSTSSCPFDNGSSPPFVLRTININSTIRRPRSRSESQSCTPRQTCGSMQHTPRQATSASLAPVAADCCVTPVPPRLCPVTSEIMRRLANELDVSGAVRRTIPTPRIRQIAPYMCVSGEEAAHAPALLQTSGITHVLNVAKRDTSCGGQDLCNGLNIQYKCIDTRDDAEYPILCYHFDEFARLVDEVRDSGGRVLVHCVAGINRSVTLCVAYLIDRCGLDLLTACRIVRGSQAHDTYILDNVGFRHQLVDFCTGRCPTALQHHSPPTSE
eukprot:PhM_4_TR2875/c0_g1_i1/m.96963